jgi:hypothetical protein
MKSNTIGFAVTLIGLFNVVFCLSSFSKNQSPEKGIFDGKIGNDQIILVAETTDNDKLKGYFVINRGKAVEESHSFSLSTSGGIPFFQSDLYVGPLKSSKINSTAFEGTLSLMNKRKRFLFWRQKVDLSLVRRDEIQVNPSERYQKEIYSNVEVKSDLVYGKAKGLWTRSPYSDDPYITTLSKGLVKSFNDPEIMDLKLDIYYPKTDIFKNRPLVMLIHGGAFYIGSKESAAEQSLATSLAKRGYVVASIDYRLGFKLSPGDVELSAYRAVQDAHAALRFLAHNAAGLGVNSSQIYVGGTSAGAVASLNVAFLDNDERPKRILENEKEGYVTKIEASGNKYTEAFEIKAVANMWGAVADLNIIDKEEKISVLSIHGTADGIVPYEYDHPFQNSLMVNRLLMDKMYGSKPIHDRLQILGNRNRLISLKDMGHEPELDNYKTLNQYMDTMTYQVTKFFYEETAPAVVLPSSQLSVSENADLKTIYYEVNNGASVKVSVDGGVKVNANPTDATIIWLKNSSNRQLKILTSNEFDAWNEKFFSIRILR